MMYKVEVVERIVTKVMVAASSEAEAVAKVQSGPNYWMSKISNRETEAITVQRVGHDAGGTHSADGDPKQPPAFPPATMQ